MVCSFVAFDMQVKGSHDHMFKLECNSLSASYMYMYTLYMYVHVDCTQI